MENDYGSNHLPNENFEEYIQDMRRTPLKILDLNFYLMDEIKKITESIEKIFLNSLKTKFEEESFKKLSEYLGEKRKIYILLSPFVRFGNKK